MNQITVRVRRFDPTVDKEPWYKTYSIPIEEGMSVLRCLQYIYEEVDGGLAFRGDCKIGFCGLCAVKVNGKKKLACRTVISDEKEIVIEPINDEEIIRDLICRLQE
jgi:succinate dehydrogenase / fumarate reductase iron-sulfur subunit